MLKNIMASLAFVGFGAFCLCGSAIASTGYPCAKLVSAPCEKYSDVNGNQNFTCQIATGVSCESTNCTGVYLTPDNVLHSQNPEPPLEGNCNYNP